MAKKVLTMNNSSNLIKKDIDDAFRDFIKHCRVKNLVDSTLDYYENSYYKFREFYNGDIEDINSTVVDDFILYLREVTEMNDISINTFIKAIRTILYYFMKIGYLEKFNITIYKAEKKVKETYTDAELELLLKKPNLKQCDFTEYRTWVIINFLMGTAARANTICNIRIKDLDLDSAVVLFATTKNKKQQVMPISNQLCSVLKEYLNYRQHESEDDYLFVSVYSQKLNSNSLRTSIAKYNQRRGVMKTSVHLFRHTFAKKWIQSQGNIFTLQKILGHSTLDMVKEYVNLFDDDIREDYDKYNPLQNFNNSKHLKIKKSKGDGK